MNRVEFGSAIDEFLPVLECDGAESLESSTVSASVDLLPLPEPSERRLDVSRIRGGGQGRRGRSLGCGNEIDWWSYRQGCGCEVLDGYDGSVVGLVFMFGEFFEGHWWHGQSILAVDFTEFIDDVPRRGGCHLVGRRAGQLFQQCGHSDVQPKPGLLCCCGCRGRPVGGSGGACERSDQSDHDRRSEDGQPFLTACCCVVHSDHLPWL